MAQPPEIKPERVARALRAVTTASLSRQRAASQAALADLAADRDTPVETVLAKAKTELGQFTPRAVTAQQRHQETAQWAQTRATNSR